LIAIYHFVLLILLLLYSWSFGIAISNQDLVRLFSSYGRRFGNFNKERTRSPYSTSTHTTNLHYGPYNLILTVFVISLSTPVTISFSPSDYIIKEKCILHQKDNDMTDMTIDAIYWYHYLVEARGWFPFLCMVVKCGCVRRVRPIFLTFTW